MYCRCQHRIDKASGYIPLTTMLMTPERNMKIKRLSHNALLFMKQKKTLCNHKYESKFYQSKDRH